MSTLLSIVGPTASGKTGLSLELARQFNAPVISADSVQIYQGLDIGSGKVTAAEAGDIPHYMIDVVRPDEEFSAGDFERKVDELLAELFRENEVVLLVGGAGFYFQAVWEGFDAMPEIPAGVRQQLNAEYEDKGVLPLVQELREADPVTFEKIDRQNHRRVIRALEIYRHTGRPISAFQAQKLPKEKAYRDLRIGLEWPRAELYARIDRRVEDMVAAGLEQEVRQLVKQYGEAAPGLLSVGYREWFDYFNGTYDHAEAVRLIQRNSRRYAKRQLTWFRRDAQIQWFSPKERASIGAWVNNKLGNDKLGI